MMTQAADHEIRDEVRAHYGEVARSGSSCCSPGCCTPGGASTGPTPDAVAQRLGYTAAELSAVPEGANLGLGCGNPQAIAALRTGETVVDLGSGAGLSVSGVKSRVQRGRQQLRGLLERCCEIALDARGTPVSCAPRPGAQIPGGCCPQQGLSPQLKWWRTK